MRILSHSLAFSLVHNLSTCFSHLHKCCIFSVAYIIRFTYGLQANVG